MCTKLRVNTIQAAGPPQRQLPLPRQPGTVGILSSWLLAAQRWRHVRHAIRQAARHDDRMLKDIGMHRSEIERAVRCGRDR